MSFSAKSGGGGLIRMKFTLIEFPSNGFQNTTIVRVVFRFCFFVFFTSKSEDFGRSSNTQCATILLFGVASFNACVAHI